MRLDTLLESARVDVQKSERKPDIEALCKHLRQIGLDTTVESKHQEISFRNRIFGAFVLYGIIFCIFVRANLYLLLLHKNKYSNAFFLMQAHNWTSGFVVRRE